jgi:hypothetical protein
VDHNQSGGVFPKQRTTIWACILTKTFLLFDDNSFRTWIKRRHWSVQNGCQSLQLFCVCRARNSCRTLTRRYSAFQSTVPALFVISHLLYKNEEVFSLSLYLKTAIVGKNGNTLPLTEMDISSLAGME